MLEGKRVAVVLPAYNAARTLRRTVDEIPRDVVDDIILTDDASRDETADLARAMGLHTLRHDANRGYGANQKTCYAAALARGADIVVMLHPDYQYSPRLVGAMASMVASGHYDVVMASRILGKGALIGGMPRYKYLFNRVLTLAENMLLGQKLSEYHSGYRAWSRAVLERLPLLACSDDFVFDNQMIAQAFHFGFRVGEMSCPTRYFAEASSINFRRSVVYGLGVLRTAAQVPAASAGRAALAAVRGRRRRPPRAGPRRGSGRAGVLLMRRLRVPPPVLFGAALVAMVVALVAARLMPGGAGAWVAAGMRAVRHGGPLGIVAFAAAQVLIAASGVLPASLVGIAAGAVYGVPAGFALAACSTLAGAWLAFRASRSMLRPRIERWLAERGRLRALDRNLAGERWKLVCLLRCSPIMPFAVTSYALGLSSVGERDYLLGTLAALPALFGYVCLGGLTRAGVAAGAAGAGPVRWAILVLGVAATVALTLCIGRILVRTGVAGESTDRGLRAESRGHGTVIRSMSIRFRRAWVPPPHRRLDSGGIHHGRRLGSTKPLSVSMQRWCQHAARSSARVGRRGFFGRGFLTLGFGGGSGPSGGWGQGGMASIRHRAASGLRACGTWASKVCTCGSCSQCWKGPAAQRISMPRAISQPTRRGRRGGRGLGGAASGGGAS